MGSTALPEIGNEVRVKFSPLAEFVLKRDQLRILDAVGECWSELPVELPAAKPVQVSLFVEEDMVECVVHHAYSLAARILAKSGKLGAP